MAEKKVYSTTVLGAKPHRGRPAQGSAEVEGNVEYKESKSKTPLTDEQKKGSRSIGVASVGTAVGAALFGAGSDAKRDYEEGRVLARNRAGRRRQKILRPDNL